MEKSMIKAILACDEEGGIGKDGDLPWPHNPADLKWFKQNTVGCSVVMGRNTWYSLPVRPLPDRENVVVSSGEIDCENDDGVFAVDIKTLLSLLKEMNVDQDVWIIGGAQLIEATLPYVQEFWLSRIDGVYDCDVFLPLTKIKEEFSIVNKVSTPELKYEVYKRES